MSAGRPTEGYGPWRTIVGIGGDVKQHGVDQDTPQQIVRLFLRHGLIVVATGIGAGIAGAVAAGQSLASLVFGVTVTDPLTLGTVAVLLVAVTLLACYIPARSATRLDPMTALRSE